MRIPKHVGIIPDGNRRWAQNKGMTKDKGYENGLDPGKLHFMDLLQIILKDHLFRLKLLQMHV